MSRLARFSTCIATLFALTHCNNEAATVPDGSGGSNPAGGSSAQGGSTSTGGSTSAGGATSTGGTNSPTGGSTGTTGGANATGGNRTGGTTGTTGGANATGGTNSPTGGANATGGTTGTTGGANATGGNRTGGTTGTTGGANSTGGVTSPTGGTATGGTATGGTGAVDCKGQALAKAGDTTSASRGYLNLGDMRLINNRWGSDELGCTGTTMSVSTTTGKALGWSFNRPTCGGSNAKPDYPELEFGVAPFGTGNDAALLTSPSCSSTSLLPIQLKNITTASITLTNYSITLPNPGCGCTTVGSTTTCTCSWNLDFEFWLSNDNPITNPNPGVYAELIGFWGWQVGRWPCDTALTSKTVASSGKTYKLCHQSDTWNSTTPHWRYFQFWDTVGPQTSFNGKVDLKPFIDWLVSAYAVSTDKWLTRIEIGTEIDDKTSGSAALQNVAFEINGQSRTPQFAP
jgi:hypothetical protein